MFTILKCLKLKNIQARSERIFFQLSSYCKQVALRELGELMTPIKDEKYDTGQVFLHKVFGYRGIILFPWEARIFDRDLLKNVEKPLESVNKDFSIQNHIFYKVLMDSRDCPYSRSFPESDTFLGNSSKCLIYCISGVDYVAHEDIMPYKATEKFPIHHDLFDKLLRYDSEKVPHYVAQEPLKAMQSKNLEWLELSDVYRETTEGVRVSVIPYYMGYHEKIDDVDHFWRYCIRLENFNDYSVQLRERSWRIFSLSGSLGTTRGRGVVGQEPILSKDSPAFQYSSHVRLQSSNGHMWGTFRMQREDGHMFDCRIPPFPLDSKANNSSPHMTDPAFV